MKNDEEIKCLNKTDTSNDELEEYRQWKQF